MPNSRDRGPGRHPAEASGVQGPRLGRLAPRPREAASRAVALGLALWSAVPLARAETPAAPTVIASPPVRTLVATDPIEVAAPTAPLAVVISGGGTKGAYMAGHLYYMGLARRASPVELKPIVFTGASAGAINALLTALTTCAPAEPDPTASVYWRSWVPVGIRQMYVPDKVSATGLLTTDGFLPAIEALRERWTAGLPASCDVLVGVSVTRAVPRQIVPAPGMPALPRSHETAILRITGQGAGQPPLLRNVVDPTRGTPQILLPVDGADATPFDALIQLVLASAAFPLGFDPVPVAHCLGTPGQPPLCTPEMARVEPFVDGGVFDNQPLGLALQALRAVDVDADGVRVRTTHPGLEAPATSRVYLLDPAAIAWPTGADDTAPVPDSLFQVVGALGGVIASAQSGEMMTVFDAHPEVARRLLVGRTWLPHVSDTFSGLLERSFREFDFYLGMYSAARSVAEATGVAKPYVPALDTPELRAAWRPFFCLRAVVDGSGDPSICDTPELSNFGILLQISIDALSRHCRGLVADGAPAPATDSALCAGAMAGDLPRRVPGVVEVAPRERRRLPGEADLMHTLRRLGLYGFEFHDLGLEAGDADRAGERVIRLAHDMVRDFAHAQPRHRGLTGVAGQLAVDGALGYLPPRHILYLTAGSGGEFGYSVGFQRRSMRWLRFNTALASEGLTTWISPAPNYFTLSPRAGVEFEAFGSAWVQVRLALRAGYQLSTVDRFTTGVCDDAAEPSRPCSRFVTDLALSASVAGLLRLQLSGVWAPKLTANQIGLFQLRPTVGVQFNAPF